MFADAQSVNLDCLSYLHPCPVIAALALPVNNTVPLQLACPTQEDSGEEAVVSSGDSERGSVNGGGGGQVLAVASPGRIQQPRPHTEAPQHHQANNGNSSVKLAPDDLNSLNKVGSLPCFL